MFRAYAPRKILRYPSHEARQPPSRSGGWWYQWDGCDAKRRLVGEYSTQERYCHVIDWNVSLRSSLRAAVMCVAMEDRGHGVTVQRLLKPTGSQKRKNLWRLTLDRGADRGVMQDHNALSRLQPRDSLF
jgi:hypothetical protein